MINFLKKTKWYIKSSVHNLAKEYIQEIND